MRRSVAEVDATVMARQVGPRERKPEHSRAHTARDRDEDVLGEFHQGPQAPACRTRPDIRLQPIPCPASLENQLGDRAVSI